jgi:hypothetical protein
VAALLCRPSYHMQRTYISNGRPSLHLSFPAYKNPQKFFFILWLIYYTHFFLSLWREGFCFVKSRQVCFLGRRDPNTPTGNGYFSVSPFWNMYYKIVGLQYLALFNPQSPAVWCVWYRIISYRIVYRCTSNPSHKCYIKLHQIFPMLTANDELWNVNIWVQQSGLFCGNF